MDPRTGLEQFWREEPWPFQSVAIRYTDYAILTAVYERIILKLILTRYDGRVWDGFLFFPLEDTDNLL